MKIDILNIKKPTLSNLKVQVPVTQKMLPVDNQIVTDFQVQYFLNQQNFFCKAIEFIGFSLLITFYVSVT